MNISMLEWQLIVVDFDFAHDDDVGVGVGVVVELILASVLVLKFALIKVLNLLNFHSLEIVLMIHYQYQ